MINIIVPNYNHQTYLPDVINGMIDQVTAQWRLLLYNDDPAVDIKDLRLIDGRIHTFADQMNKGQSTRFNQGIKDSNGEFKSDWVCFMGADDIAMSWKLNTILDTYWHDPDADVIYTDAVQLCGNHKREYIKSRTFEIEDLKKANFIVASTVAVKAEFAKDVLFDEDIVYGEDWLWYHKLYLAGARFKYVPIPTIYYRDYTSNIGIRYGTDWSNMKRQLVGRIVEMYK